MVKDFNKRQDGWYNSVPYRERSYSMVSHRPQSSEIMRTSLRSNRVKSFWISAAEIARLAKPGQFIMIWIPGVDEMPISVADSIPESGEIEATVSKVGDFSAAFHKKEAGDKVGIRGPYGTSFSFKGQRLCLIAGGYGVAPLHFYAKAARRMEKEVTVLIGARTAIDLLYLEEFDNLGCRVLVTTNDGSRGRTGVVTDLLPELLQAGAADRILACGPEAMMFKACQMAKEYGVALEMSMERLMKCGIGLCATCVVGPYRVCTDGPVFPMEMIYDKTEFGIWTRDKGGGRVPVNRTAMALAAENNGKKQ